MADLSKINVNNTEYDLKDSGALPTSGGEMTGTITTPADNSKGITPKTDRTGILGSITKWFNLLHVQDIRTQAIKFFGTSTTSASTNGYTLYASGTPSSNVNINVADLLTKPELDGTVFVEKTYAEYEALSEAQKNDGKVEYFITDLDDIDYAVQDDPTATDLVNDEVPTGGTIDSWANSKHGYVTGSVSSGAGWTLFRQGSMRTLNLLNFNNTSNNIANFIPVADRPKADNTTRLSQIQGMAYSDTTRDILTIIVNSNGNFACGKISTGTLVAFQNVRGSVTWSVD